MKIVRLSKNSNLNRIDKVFNWFRFSGRGPAGIIDTLDTLDEKATVVAADLALVGDSADSFVNKSATWLQVINSVIRTALDLIYSKISGTGELGLITTAATINATTNTEYTGNITANITLNLEGFTVARPTVKVMLDLVTAGGALTVTIAGYTFLWPPNQTQTLTDLADGSYSILFSWNATTGKVVPRVQQVA